jgi:hypothetical protein
MPAERFRSGANAAGARWPLPAGLELACDGEDDGRAGYHPRRCPRMCEEFWMRRWVAEADESRRLWEEFDRTRRVRSSAPGMDEEELELEQPEPAPVAER